MIRRLATAFRSDTLASRAKRGTILTGVDFLGSNALRLVSNLILTRLLFPEAFGLMALVQVVTGAVQMFSDIGIRASIVRHERGEEPDFVNTAWTLQVIRGLVLWLAVVALSPFVARFYEEPMLAQLLPVAGLSALIAGFTPTSLVAANRHLILGRVTALSIGNQICNIMITVVLAWWLQSVWAIVFGILAGGVLRNTTIRIFMPGPRNRFRFELSAARDLIDFGKFILIGTIASFLVQNADRAILGKFIPIDLLGVYVIALTFAAMPQRMMQAFTWKILFPLYSRKPPHESAKNRRKISRARFGLGAGAISIAATFVFFGDPILRFLYPDNFHAAGGIAVLIVIGFLPSLVLFNYNSVLLAVNRSDLHALAVSVHAVIKVTLLYFAVSHFGIAGAALTPIASTLLYYPLLITLIRPWHAWDIRYDILFLSLSLIIAVLGWHLNADVIKTVLSPPS